MLKKRPQKATAEEERKTRKAHEEAVDAAIRARARGLGAGSRVARVNGVAHRRTGYLT